MASLLLWPSELIGVARPGPAPGGTSPPASIPSDCSVSVTAQLHQWLGTVPDFTTVTFPAGACYRIDETFVIRERQGLTFAGNGATFRTVTNGVEAPSPRTRSHWRLAYSTDITITDLVIIGPNTLGLRNPSLEAQHGIEIGGGIGISIGDVTIREVYGDAVNVASSKGDRDNPLPDRDSEDVVVENSTLQLMGRQGISVTAGKRVILRGNTLEGVMRSAIDLEPHAPNATVEDILIESNSLAGYEIAMVAGAGVCATFRRITIRDNTAVGGGIRIGKSGCPFREGLVVERNTVTLPATGVGTAFLIITKFSDVAVRENLVEVANPAPAVFFSESAGSLLVEANSFCGATAAYGADGLTGPVTEADNSLDC